MPKKKTVAIFTTKQGHLSIAEAAKETLQKKYQVEIFFAEDPLFGAYVFLYQNLPSLVKIPYNFSHNNSAIESMHKIFQKRYQAQIEKFFAKVQPNLMISAYFMYNSNLLRLQKLTKVPFINLLTDPRTLPGVVVAPQAQINLAFDQKQIKTCQASFPQGNYQSTGWFVRDKFEKKYQPQNVRKKLKLDPQKPTFLIAAGSEGTNMVLKILPGLFLTKKPIQIVVACGNNKTLYKSLTALQKILNKTERTNTLIPLKFTAKIHLYMQAADLVIGKAGPNTLFESVATQTPFFAITHISGQEDGNLDIIRDYNLGYVEENILKAQKLLKQIIAHPEQLIEFENSILKLKKYNQQAKEKLSLLVEKSINK